MSVTSAEDHSAAPARAPALGVRGYSRFRMPDNIISIDVQQRMEKP